MKYRFTISFLSFCFAVLTSVSALAQEKATIKGQISLTNNQAADNVSVVLKGTKIGTSTDANGFYEIKNIKPGNYVIKVSGIGYSSKEKSVSLNSGDSIIEDFRISENSQELNEIVVNGNRKNPLARKETQQVSRLPLKNLENPQVYTTITAELLKEQVVTNIDDALKNAPGLTPLWASTGRGGDGAGYFSLRGFAVQPTMINGLPGLSNGGLDPANIDKIEVIKGPSGTLFGSSLISYGGLINLTTKKPYDHFGGEVSYTAGSNGLNRVTADVNTTLDDEHKINFRVNTAYHTENSFQDAGLKKSFFFAPSLSYQVNDKLSFFINTEFMNNKQTNATMLFLDRGSVLRVHNMNELGYDNKRSYTSNELLIETPSYNLQAQMNYKFNDQWSSQTVVSRGSSSSDGYYSYLYESTSSPTYSGVTQGIILGRSMNYQNSTTLTTDIQQNFIGDFKIGNMRNRIVAGLDYFNRGMIDNSSNYVANGVVYIGNLDVKTVNEEVFKITNPADYITNNDSGNLTKAGTDALIANAGISVNRTKQEVYSAYVSDVFNFTPALSAMASLRVDRFVTAGNVATKDDDYNQTAFSPKFGLVYQPILDKVSIFANYMDGFANSAPVTEILADGSTRPRTFGPEHANQFEVGTKLNLFKDKFYATFSYYDIQVKDQVYVIYGATTQTAFQDGAQRNKGFEAEFVSSPITGLNIVAGYSYVDAVLNAGDPSFVGQRPESSGPRNLANLWASYKFQEGDLQGFGLGFGGNYADKNYIMNRNLVGKFSLPSYTVLNSSIFYGTEKYTLTLKLDNIANVDTYDGWSTIHPRNMRTVSANFSYRF